MNIELLSPAGSMEALKQAIKYGADAVYLGGQSFGARAFAHNFSDEELLFAIDYAHSHNTRLYLTVNTLLKNKEIHKGLYNYIEPLYKAGLDAVIVQDYGVINFINREFPNMEIHGSTQMTVTGQYSVELFKNKPLTRIVLPRELRIEEIKKIYKATGGELEVFAHGALCYCYSGQCIMSSMLGGRSANRGKCAQSCRLPYSNDKFEKKHILSLKDLSTIDYLYEMRKAGVASLKLEGRMKSPEYVAGITAIYRKYIDLSTKPYKVEKKDYNILEALFSRSGFTKGFLLGKTQEMITYDSPTGKATKSFKEIKGYIEQLNRTREKSKSENEKIDISAKLYAYCGSPLKLQMICNYNKKQIEVTLKGNSIVEYAENHPIDKEKAFKQISKIKDSIFKLEYNNFTLMTDNNSYVDIAGLNHLRREAIVLLTEKASTILSNLQEATNNRQIQSEIILEEYHNPITSGKTINFVIGKLSQLKILLELINSQLSNNRYNFSLDMDFLDINSVRLALKLLLEKNISLNNIYVALPRMVTADNSDKLKGEIEVLVNGYSNIKFIARVIEEVAILKSSNIIKDNIIGDSGIYVTNNEAIDFLSSYISSATLSLELNSGEIAEIVKNNKSLSLNMIIYGKVPLMVSRMTVDESDSYLIDRKGYKFTTHKNSDYDFEIIYNSLPINLFGEYSEISKYNLNQLFVILTDEEIQDIKVIVDEINNIDSENSGALDNKYTKGHFRRGIV